MIPLPLLAFGKWLIGPIGRWLLIGGALAFVAWRFHEAAWHSGYAARDVEARAEMARMEQRLAKRMRENEGLTDPEIDCQLKRLRNPKAECAK